MEKKDMEKKVMLKQQRTLRLAGKRKLIEDLENFMEMPEEKKRKLRNLKLKKKFLYLPTQPQNPKPETTETSTSSPTNSQSQQKTPQMMIK